MRFKHGLSESTSNQIPDRQYPHLIGTLASTGGTVRTAILYGTTANRTTATVIELFRDGTVAAGHTFTLRDISFGDSRALGADFGGSFGNLYKF